MTKSYQIWSRVDKERYDWLKQREQETGVSTSTYIRTLLYKLYEQEQRPCSYH
jgi:hypothetical protein